MRRCQRLPSGDRHTVKARRVCAVRSGQDRSNGSRPQPRQNVGRPPSRFCSSSNQRTPFRTAASTSSSRGASRCSASNAPAVSSASGTAPGRSLQPQPPGPAPVNGWRARCCWSSNQRRSGSRSPDSSGLPSSPLLNATDRQGAHPGRQVAVDRPAAVVALPGNEELSPAVDYRVIGEGRTMPVTGSRSRSAAPPRGSHRSWAAAARAGPRASA